MPSRNTLSIPVIDPKVEHVGVSGLRKLDAKQLREFNDKMLVIKDHNTPLAVLLSYEKYLVIQDKLQAVVETLDLLNDSEEVQALLTGLREFRNGKTKTISQIREDLKNEGG